jgi:hypothetical protein
MSSRLLDLFRLGRCSHEFSWPRRWPDGEYYQVCLLCGEEYKYDWNTMSRLERVSGLRPVENTQAGASADHAKKKPSWTPRARRIKLHGQEMKYRLAGATGWHKGEVQNISQTGVLFRASELIPDNTELEMILEMPREITGHEHMQVLARGMVVRSILPEDGCSRASIAAGIWDYTVLHEQMEAFEVNNQGQAPTNP